MCLHVISFNLPREIAVLHPNRTTTLGSPEGKAVILTLSNAKGQNPRTPPRLNLPQQLGVAFASFLSLLLIFTLTGCHSAFINATVSNHTATAIALVQVEYPSASFGIQTIAPGVDFHYRFKILGSGPMKITYTDTAQHEQKSTGPTLTEGTEGPLTITVASDGVHWQAPPAAH